MKPQEVFQRLLNSGCTALAACQVASKLGLNKLERLTGLRQVYALSLVEAKTVLLQESGVATSVEEHQAKISKMLLDGGPEELRKLSGDES